MYQKILWHYEITGVIRNALGEVTFSGVVSSMCHVDVIVDRYFDSIFYSNVIAYAQSTNSKKYPSDR